MSSFEPFPFKDLPRYTSSQVQVSRRLADTFYFFKNRVEPAEVLKKVFQEILKIKPVSIKLAHAESTSLDQVMATTTQHSLFAAVTIEPFGKTALVMFESLLAKVMAHHMLSAQPIQSERLAQWLLSPLTSLEEGVVEYAIVNILHAVSQSWMHKNFSLRFQDVLRDSKRLNGYYNHKDDLAVISVQLKLADQDFYLKLILPLGVTQDMGLSDQKEAIVEERAKHFESMGTEFSLIAGHVELMPEEIEALSVGDIILLDDAGIDYKAGVLSGEAKVMMSGEQSASQGFAVDVSAGRQKIIAKITQTL